jgi:NAD(P)-dependent dehydrogenase (short-subunit alcohol dehydrogenase family)
MELGLKGKAALVTGASEGIGMAIAGSACHAALRMFSKELSIELGPLNIRVNSLAPGRIQTARGDRLLAATAAARGTSLEAILSGAALVVDGSKSVVI